MPERIVKGQKIAPLKKRLSREFRRTMTPAEAKFWSLVRRKAINGCKFRRQQIIDGFIVDFYCHERSLIVEIDGDIHAEHVEEDRVRQEHLENRGFHVLRFQNVDVLSNTDTVLETIFEATRSDHV